MPFDPQEYEPDLSDLMDDEILRTLVEADALLSDESKWCQEDFSLNGAVCIYGAIGRGNDEFCAQIYDVVESRYSHPLHAIRAECGAAQLLKQQAHATDLASWNDAPERTFSDVKALFARAIDARAHTLRGA